MTYLLEIRPHLHKLFRKMEKKNRLKLEIINKKVKEILEDPHYYKPLKAQMHHIYRVHISGSFVMTFSINESTNTVILEDFDHHDNIYK